MFVLIGLQKTNNILFHLQSIKYGKWLTFPILGFSSNTTFWFLFTVCFQQAKDWLLCVSLVLYMSSIDMLTILCLLFQIWLWFLFVLSSISISHIKRNHPVKMEYLFYLKFIPPVYKILSHTSGDNVSVKN